MQFPVKLGDSQFGDTCPHRRSYSVSLSVPSCEEVPVCPTVPVRILGISRRARWSKWIAWFSRPLVLDHGCCFTWEPSSHNRQQRLAKEPTWQYQRSASYTRMLIEINIRTALYPH